jgi:hypothetical protein
MTLLFFLIFFAIVVAIAASARGRSGVGWFLLSFVISPLIGLILVLVLPNRRTDRLLREQHERLLAAINGRDLEKPHHADSPEDRAWARGVADKQPYNPLSPEGRASARPLSRGSGSVFLIVCGVIFVFIVVGSHFLHG